MEAKKRLQCALESAGYEPFSYSGRGMFGAQCLAVTSESAIKIIVGAFESWVLDGGQRGDVEEFANILRSAKTDNMGYDTVVYWPGVPMDEEKKKKDGREEKEDDDDDCDDCE